MMRGYIYNGTGFARVDDATVHEIDVPKNTNAFLIGKNGTPLIMVTLDGTDPEYDTTNDDYNGFIVGDIAHTLVPCSTTPESRENRHPLKLKRMATGTSDVTVLFLK